MGRATVACAVAMLAGTPAAAGATTACRLSGAGGTALLAAGGDGPGLWLAIAVAAVAVPALAMLLRRRRHAAAAAALVATGALLPGGHAAAPEQHVTLACYGTARYLDYRDGPERIITAPAGELGLTVPAATPVVLEALGRGHRAGPLESFLGLSRPGLPAVATSLRLAPTPAGEYRGRCPGLCGDPDAAVDLELTVLAERDYRQWREQHEPGLPEGLRRRPFGELMSLGETVYRRRCAACHGAGGQGVTGVYPGLRHSAMVRGPIEPHLLFQYYGRPGSPMKAFGDALSALELAAVTTFQRNALGHDSGDVVQPWMVELIRRSKGGD